MNIEIKGSLARLLATENLLVEHKQVQTASFNVEKRVLTLPMWSKASNTVYNLLVVMRSDTPSTHRTPIFQIVDALSHTSM